MRYSIKQQLLQRVSQHRPLFTNLASNFDWYIKLMFFSYSDYALYNSNFQAARNLETLLKGSNTPSIVCCNCHLSECILVNDVCISHNNRVNFCLMYVEIFFNNFFNNIFLVRIITVLDNWTHFGLEISWILILNRFFEVLIGVIVFQL